MYSADVCIMGRVGRQTHTDIVQTAMRKVERYVRRRMCSKTSILVMPKLDNNVVVKVFNL